MTFFMLVRINFSKLGIINHENHNPPIWEILATPLLAFLFWHQEETVIKFQNKHYIAPNTNKGSQLE